MAYFNINFSTIRGQRLQGEPDHLIYYCWTRSKLSDIQVGTTERLRNDVISGFVFHQVNKQTEKIDIEYSILVKQNALTGMNIGPI